jgi:hypothetical protein
MDAEEISDWFDAYLEVFAACGRGDRDTSSLLAYYGVPLVLTTDEGVLALTSDEQVVAGVQQQVDGMRASDYQHSEILSSDVTVLNASSALYRGEFSRRRRDGDEINRLAVTYLITGGPDERRISDLAVHGA